MATNSLLEAASGGNIADVIKLLDAGADVNGPDLKSTEKEFPLFVAASRGKAHVCRVLLARGANVNGATTSKRTALMVAAANDYAAICEILLDGGAEVDGRDFLGATPLFLAARNDSVSAVSLLLDHGANMNTPENGGRLPLLTASLFNCRATCAALLYRGVDVNFANPKTGGRAVHSACYEGHNQLCGQLLDCGAEVNLANFKGMTALLFAALQGQWTTFELLLQRGADGNRATSNGVSILETCTRKSHNHFMTPFFLLCCANNVMSSVAV